ncbi:DUF1236 domain-containing protein [Phyllobacterium myrsinacearum]|uniref:DUF1236 domain-containing protein n=1 Tax=Phyllobacterium myrsinacearum TaxID=28101 RepID=A0A839ED58_9HYPH|nr:DUF1236 domain-containing protein [Phyllobacterium myrsinacearum]MBA8876639.1 hypothetical protein [Phyllobacterium myrsinacearum]
MNKVLILTASALIATGGFALAQDKVIVEVPQPARDYVIAHPSDPVVIDGDLAEGYVVPQSVAVRPIPESPGYGYIYVDGRPVIVSLENRQVVYLSDSQDGPVPEDVITYVEQNPVDTVAIDEVTTGAVVPDDIDLAPVPSQPRYAYIYVDGAPALVDARTRRVVWVR